MLMEIAPPLDDPRLNDIERRPEIPLCALGEGARGDGETEEDGDDSLHERILRRWVEDTLPYWRRQSRARVITYYAVPSLVARQRHRDRHIHTPYAAYKHFASRTQ